jgi:hypothetical protein
MLGRTLWMLVMLACFEAAPVQAGFDDSGDGWGGDGYDLGCEAACILMIGSVLIVPPIVFTTAQISYGVQGRWFPLGWAIPELIYGGLMTSFAFAAASDANDAGGVAAFAVFSGWLTLHAILSIALGDPSTRERPRLRAVAAPLRGGAWLGVAGFL